jgi:hypothetical protein
MSHLVLFVEGHSWYKSRRFCSCFGVFIHNQIFNSHWDIEASRPSLLFLILCPWFRGISLRLPRRERLVHSLAFAPSKYTWKWKLELFQQVSSLSSHIFILLGCLFIFSSLLTTDRSLWKILCCQTFLWAIPVVWSHSSSSLLDKHKRQSSRFPRKVTQIRSLPHNPKTSLSLLQPKRKDERRWGSVHPASDH